MVAAGWSEAQKRAYVLADNQLAITGSGWDTELLRLELGELNLAGFDLSLTGFGDLELKDLLAERTEGLTDPDDAPAAPEHPVSQTGDLWLLGKHRLLCGDSTVATDVERVLGGVAPHLMVTDPPYLSRQQASRSFRKHLSILIRVRKKGRSHRTGTQIFPMGSIRRQGYPDSALIFPPHAPLWALRHRTVNQEGRAPGSSPTRLRWRRSRFPVRQKRWICLLILCPHQRVSRA